MPNYTFRDTNTEEIIEFTMTVDEMEQFEKDNPHMKWVPVTPNGYVDAVRIGRKKPDSGFREILKEMKRKTLGTGINTFGSVTEV